ncbi:uncharacterized protein LOC120147857 [Hibiscus syriacus]|uniref:uncharacterized protein LOC120147857 n=1 Tax=Hibiscus syriacus TaxID=106335 RepID=UPI0019207DD7|nr:uncharacterized protein LOC120147857 [Hibiscus syriacus]
MANQQNHIELTYKTNYPPPAKVRPVKSGIEELPHDFQEVSEKGKVDSEITQQLKSLEERLRSVEVEPFYGMDVRKLILVSDLIFPLKFKAPDFEKYDGTTCPSAHLTMFCRRMADYTENEKLLIHYFQDSLIGSAVKWCNQLAKSYIKSWRDLARAFLEQYRHVTDLVPDRWTLQNMEKRHSKTFRQYAQRWRDVESQVQPPLLEKETTVIFVNTLKAPYLGHLLVYATKNFVDLVISGELIENAIRNGKIEGGKGSKKPYFKKKESEVNHASIHHKNYDASVTITQPRAEKANTYENRVPRRENTRQAFSPVPVPYLEIYASLLKVDLMCPYKLTPMQSPYPHWYNANAQCDYHTGIVGHDIENCSVFKMVVQNFINAGDFEFKTPAASAHPLQNHGGQLINMIDEREI